MGWFARVGLAHGVASDAGQDVDDPVAGTAAALAESLGPKLPSPSQRLVAATDKQPPDLHFRRPDPLGRGGHREPVDLDQPGGLGLLACGQGWPLVPQRDAVTAGVFVDPPPRDPGPAGDLADGQPARSQKSIDLAEGRGSGKRHPWGTVDRWRLDVPSPVAILAWSFVSRGWKLGVTVHQPGGAGQRLGRRPMMAAAWTLRSLSGLVWR